MQATGAMSDQDSDTERETQLPPWEYQFMSAECALMQRTRPWARILPFAPTTIQRRQARPQRLCCS
eukprot:92586-Pyramimonas_sp.AAC.1